MSEIHQCGVQNCTQGCQKSFLTPFIPLSHPGGCQKSFLTPLAPLSPPGGVSEIISDTPVTPQPHQMVYQINIFVSTGHTSGHQNSLLKFEHVLPTYITSAAFLRGSRLCQWQNSVLFASMGLACSRRRDPDLHHTMPTSQLYGAQEEHPVQIWPSHSPLSVRRLDVAPTSWNDLVDPVPSIRLRNPALPLTFSHEMEIQHNGAD